MDPLTIFGAVTGGISAASETVKVLDKAITLASKVKEAPELAACTLRHVKMMRYNMIRFQQLLDSGQHARDRGLYIPLDDAQDTFTDCVTSLDELESLLKPLSDPGLGSLAMSERLEWAMKDNRINQLSKRVQDAQSSLGLMLTILQNESLIEVQKAIAGLSDICQRIAPNVAHLNRRSITASTVRHFNIDETDDASTIRPTAGLRPDSIIIPEPVTEENEALTDQETQRRTSAIFQERARRFSVQSHYEKALIASRPYRRAPKWDRDDVSFRSSVLNTHAMSLFSKLSNLSLGEVSTISIIALPLFCNDISNQQHYTFGKTLSNNDASQNSVARNRDDELELQQLHRSGPPTPRIELQSAPHSPSLPVKIGVSRMLKAVKRAFGPDIVSAIDWNIDPANARSPVSPKTPTSPSSFSGYSDLDIRKANLFNAHNDVPSMRQLSGLHLEDSEFHLCHGVGDAPCYGAVETTVDEEYSVEQLRCWQLDLAAANGFLKGFRCQECRKSLAQTGNMTKADRSVLELWCGSNACMDAHPELRPCACYAKMKQLSLPTEKYLGCRIVPDVHVNCARCFRLCPQCAANQKPKAREKDDDSYSLSTSSSTASIPICWGIGTHGGRLFAIQAELLTTLRSIFDHVDELSSLPYDGTKRFNYYFWQLDVRLESFEKSKEATQYAMAVLRERQSVLGMRREMLPAWRETNIAMKEGSAFWSAALGHMLNRIEDSQQIIDNLSKTNVIFIPELREYRRGLPILGDYPVTRKFFAELDGTPSYPLVETSD